MSEDLRRSPLRLLEARTPAHKLGYDHARRGRPPKPPPGANVADYRAGYESGQRSAARSPRTKPQRPQAKSLEYDPSKHYVSVRLSPGSRNKLLSKHPPQHDNTNAEHVTLVPPGTELSDRQRAMLQRHIGKQVQFHATHHASDEKDGVQAVRVRGLDHLSDKPHKHVTVSTAQGVSAQKSNELLSRQHGERLPDWIRLSGTVEISHRLGRE